MAGGVTSADCRTCGACCAADYALQESYVGLAAADLRRLSEHYRRRHVVIAYSPGGAGAPRLATKETEQGTVCCTLRGRVGERCSCTIYDRRPGACRAFEPGSSACLLARAAAGVGEP